MKRNRGEVRDDGYIFWEYRKLASGSVVEYWASPENVARKRAYLRAWTKTWLDNADNRAAYNKKAAAYAVKYRRKNPITFMLTRAKMRAKERGLAFELVAGDITIPEHCPVFGLKLRVADGIADDTSPELDRIVPNKGYVKGNVIVVSRRANRIKNDATPEELQRLASFYAGLVN
jgi:hypothetical protein